MATQRHLHPIQWYLYPNVGYEHFNYEAPWWGRLILLFDFNIFLPLIIILNYTLPRVYPVFAIVDDRRPNKRESIALGEFADGPGPSNSHKRINNSSPAAIYRLLVDNDGLQANFRGLTCALTQFTLTWLLVSIAARFFEPQYARLFLALGLVQFSTLWLHLVIAEPTPLSFWRRILPFRRTFDATWRAVVLHWAAEEITQWLPYVTASSLGIDWPHFRLFGPDNIHIFLVDLATGDSVFYLKCAFVVLVSVIGSILLIIPSQVVLTQIQASLLPIENDTIAPFDRSFQGKVRSSIVGGRGYATMSDAWSTFSWASWGSLITLYMKIILLSLAIVVFMFTVVGFQWFFIVKRSVKLNEIFL